MAGDVLFEIETDKATMEVECNDDGVLAKIIMESGKKVPVNSLVALMVEEGDDWKNVEIPVLESSKSAAQQASEKPVDATKAAPAPTPSATPTIGAKGSSKPLGPAVKTLIATHSLNPNDIVASGPQGRLLKGDVLKYLETVPESQRAKPAAATAAPVSSGAGKPASSSPAQATVGNIPTRGRGGQPAYTEIPLSNMRKVIADRLTESKTTIPHAYGSIDCHMDQIAKLRKQLKKDFDMKISVNDFVIRASALALKKVPAINATLEANGNVKQL